MKRNPENKADGTKRTVVFIQLPLLDNDTESPTENHLLAARNLSYAADASKATDFFDLVTAPPEMDRWDNHAAAEYLTGQKPSAIAATLYLWNIERTLRILKLIKERQPEVFIMTGGPEVTPDHPFLFKTGIPDVAVCGEGEPVFADILNAFRTGEKTDFSNVAWRNGRKYEWGSVTAPELPLASILPPANHFSNQPDGNGTAFMETVRGCASKCAFCRYSRQRRHISRLSAEDIAARISVLRDRGAKEIRFIDPTFNARPDFQEVLTALAESNRKRTITFFAELRADTITPSTAARLAAAGVTQVEAGVQSLDPGVLKAVSRPLSSARTLDGIRHLSDAGIHTTLDAMCGLPGQTIDDVRHTLCSLASTANSHVQLLHTLLIPGTELRKHCRRLKLKSQPYPPYRVLSTSAMTADQIQEADRFAANLLGLPDAPAMAFTGKHLPDLFPERCLINIDGPGPAALPGIENRRALIFTGKKRSLFEARDTVVSITEKACFEEPDILWQFVLAPQSEEPLDLIEMMIAAIDSAPEHFIDRLSVRDQGTHRSARRIFVRLGKGLRYDPEWQQEVRVLLEKAFY